VALRMQLRVALRMLHRPPSFFSVLASWKRYKVFLVLGPMILKR
jgi:hypothetical protein